MIHNVALNAFAPRSRMPLFSSAPPFPAETMDRLGQNYEKENEKELREILTYYKEEYETDAGFYGDSGGTAEGEDGDGDDRPKSAAELLPPPFGGRPRLGSRLMVKNQFPRMSPGCLAELQAWQAALRPRAAALLLAMLVFQERTVAPQLPAVLPALWSAIDDADRTVQTRVTTAAQLVGRLAPPAAWLDQVADRIENDTDISSAARAATASLLAALLVRRCRPSHSRLLSLLRDSFSCRGSAPQRAHDIPPLLCPSGRTGRRGGPR